MQCDAEMYDFHNLKEHIRNVIIILEKVREHQMKKPWCAGWRQASPPVVFRLKVTALPGPTAIRRQSSKCERHCCARHGWLWEQVEFLYLNSVKRTARRWRKTQQIYRRLGRGKFIFLVKSVAKLPWRVDVYLKQHHFIQR